MNKERETMRLRFGELEVFVTEITPEEAEDKLLIYKCGVSNEAAATGFKVKHLPGLLGRAKYFCVKEPTDEIGRAIQSADPNIKNISFYGDR